MLPHGAGGGELQVLKGDRPPVFGCGFPQGLCYFCVIHKINRLLTKNGFWDAALPCSRCRRAASDSIATKCTNPSGPAHKAHPEHLPRRRAPRQKRTVLRAPAPHCLRESAGAAAPPPGGRAMRGIGQGLKIALPSQWRVQAVAWHRHSRFPDPAGSELHESHRMDDEFFSEKNNGFHHIAHLKIGGTHPAPEDRPPGCHLFVTRGCHPHT